MAQKYEAGMVNGVEVFHTFRGHHNEVEVYTRQVGHVTYSLYKPNGETAWQCDGTTSYHTEIINLEANPADEAAMLNAFTEMLRARRATAY